MKAIEVLNEFSGAEKQPAGIIGQGLKRMGAAALGALGAKNAAKAVGDSADAGARANAYNKEFVKYLKQQGKPINDVEYVDLNQFISNMHLPKIKLPTDGWVAPGDLENIFLDIAKVSTKGATATAAQQSSRDASVNTPQTTTSQQTAPAHATATAAEPVQPSTATSVSGAITADELSAAFKEYIDADGKITPELRGAVKTLWMKMGGIKAESVKKAKTKL